MVHENPGRIAQRESVPFTRERSKVRSLVRPPLSVFFNDLTVRFPSSCALPGHKLTQETDIRRFPLYSPLCYAPNGRFHSGHSRGIKKGVPAMARYGRIWQHLYYGWVVGYLPTVTRWSISF